MNKIFLPVIIFCMLLVIFIPFLAKAAGTGIVTCQGPSDCTLTKFFDELAAIYGIIKTVAIPLAVLAVTIGAILMMASGGNPNLLSKGKTIFWSGLIGLVLVLAATAIIDWVIKAIPNPPQNWQHPFG